MDITQYFYRTALISIDGEQASLVDPLNYKQISPLEPWLGTVLALADGQHTLEELVKLMSSRYPNGAPDGLEKTIDSVVERLIEAEVMQLNGEPVKLPYYLEFPVNEQDQNKARQLMLEDGFIKH